FYPLNHLVVEVVVQALGVFLFALAGGVGIFRFDSGVGNHGGVGSAVVQQGSAANIVEGDDFTYQNPVVATVDTLVVFTLKAGGAVG
ncbi:hypothetical protein Q4595_25940, partial [Wenyingzhuangia sp. 1_MG-2023]|nr:hypothetical protein [Wenyingzhuangia sp. 1_MG-2023]